MNWLRPVRMLRQGKLCVLAFVLSTASERVMRRDDLRSGLRIIGFERRVTLAFVVGERDVLIFRLFYGGPSWEGAPIGSGSL